MAKIGDLKSEITELLGNRSDLENYAKWCKRSILNITPRYAFEELRFTGPVLSFQSGVSSYPLNNFLQPNTSTKLTQMVLWFVYTDTTGGLGHTGYPLKYRVPSVVEPISKISGPPVFWTRLGNQFTVAPCPDQNYVCYQKYQLEHPFSDNLEQDEIQAPADWIEIFVYATALRGAIIKRALDYVSLYRTILYGDPKDPTNPGFIKSVLEQQQRDLSQNERQVRPVVLRY